MIAKTRFSFLGYFKVFLIQINNQLLFYCPARLPRSPAPHIENPCGTLAFIHSHELQSLLSNECLCKIIYPFTKRFYVPENNLLSCALLSEFRKMDRSSLLSPARRSPVPFDPKRTPKSGVLKSPSSSPAVIKRAMAADFF